MKGVDVVGLGLRDYYLVLFMYRLLSFRTERLGLSLIAVFGVHGGNP